MIGSSGGDSSSTGYQVIICCGVCEDWSNRKMKCRVVSLGQGDDGYVERLRTDIATCKAPEPREKWIKYTHVGERDYNASKCLGST